MIDLIGADGARLAAVRLLGPAFDPNFPFRHDLLPQGSSPDRAGWNAASYPLFDTSAVSFVTVETPPARSPNKILRPRRRKGKCRARLGRSRRCPALSPARH